MSKRWSGYEVVLNADWLLLLLPAAHAHAEPEQKEARVIASFVYERYSYQCTVINMTVFIQLGAENDTDASLTVLKR